MAINYGALVGSMQQGKTGEIFKVEEYLGVKGESKTHTYKIRFVVCGRMKTTSYSDIKNSRVTYNFKSLKNKHTTKKTKKVRKTTDKRRAKDKRIISLDIATNKTGSAIFIDGILLSSDVLVVSGELDTRINRMCKKIIDIIKTNNIELAIIEDIFLLQREDKSVTMYKALAKLQGALISYLIDNNVQYEMVLASVWKNKLFPSSNRVNGKEMSINYANNKYDKFFKEDEAEAICIGLWALSKL